MPGKTKDRYNRGSGVKLPAVQFYKALSFLSLPGKSPASDGWAGLERVSGAVYTIAVWTDIRFMNTGLSPRGACGCRISYIE